jgi:acetoin utilization deacetylase AcuC-like enzyme
MALGLIYDDRFLAHDTGPGHPERADRLRAIIERLQRDGTLDKLRRLPFEPATIEAIERVHDASYIDRVRVACEEGRAHMDSPDTPICPPSYDIARLAVGGVLAATDAVMAGDVASAFCAVRPPGHHAERAQAMGFCLFNNIAIAAEHLIQRHGLRRVAIVDFDVHHGNGTQHTFEHRADVLFLSCHEHPRFQYPGTGFAKEHGKGRGHGSTHNVPLMPGADDRAAREAFEHHFLPELQSFHPDALLISAGFDAADGDPIGGLTWTADGFRWITDRLRESADHLCGGRIISVLEGGYNLDRLADGVAVHLDALGATM